MKKNKVFEGDLRRAKMNLYNALSAFKLCMAPKDSWARDSHHLIPALIQYALDWLEQVNTLYGHLTEDNNNETHGH